MKNFRVGIMLDTISEVSELKSTDLVFVSDFLKGKRSLVEKQEEFSEIMKAIVELNEAENELMIKLKSEKEYNLNSSEKKIQETIVKKEKIYNEKYQELMLKDCDIEFNKIKMDKFPDGTLIKHFDNLYEMIK